MSELYRLTETVASRASAMTLYARQWLDAASAEDVVQQALVALLEQSSAPADPVAWMYRAVRNAAIDQLRSAGRRARRERSVARERREWFEASIDAPIDARAAEQALRALPIELSEVVVLRIWGGLGFAQIAEILGLAVSSVHERYSKALAQLRSALETSCRNKTMD